MIKKLSIILSLSTVLLVSHCGNKTLAKYDNGKVTLNEVEQLADIYNLKSRLDNPQLKKQLVRDYAIAKILSEKAINENLDKTDEAVYLKKLFEGNTIKNLLFKEKQDKTSDGKEKIFHARHILIRLPAGQKPVSNPGEEEKEFNQIKQIRQEILDKKIAFDDAVEKYSQDAATKPKKGDLGYFPRGVMVGPFQAAIERMAGLVKNPSMRVSVDNIKLLSKPEGSNIDLKQVSKNSIVTVLEKDNPAGWSKVETESFTVYVPTGSLESIDEEKKISSPVKTIHGWHLIQLLDAKDMDLDKYAGILEDTEFKGKEKAEQMAKSRAKMYWSRLKGAEVSKWQNDLYTFYGITEENKKLAADWQKKEYIIDNDKLKISSKEFLDFVTWLAKDQGVETKFITSNDEAIQRYFQIYTDLQIFNIEGEKMKIHESKDFKKRREIEKKQFLAELYKKKNWFSDVTYTEKELKDAYEKMKKNKPPHMKTIKPYNEMKGDLIRQVRGQKINSMTHSKMDELLKSVNLEFTEKEFKQATNGKH